MVRHRANGLSMSQVSVSDMDPPGPDSMCWYGVGGKVKDISLAG